MILYSLRSRLSAPSRWQKHVARARAGRHCCLRRAGGAADAGRALENKPAAIRRLRASCRRYGKLKEDDDERCFVGRCRRRLGAADAMNARHQHAAYAALQFSKSAAYV